MIALLAPASDEPALLPAPPLLERVLLEEPLPGAIVLIAAGVVAAVMFRQAGRDRAAVALAALGVFLGAAVYVLATAVTTERERLHEQARRAVRLVLASDARGVEAELTDGVSLTLLGRLSRMGKRDIVARVKDNTLRTYGVKDCTVLRVQAVIDAPGSARTQMHLGARSELYGISVGSWWVLHWRRDTEERWRIAAIECQQIDGIPPGTPIDPR